MGFTLNKARALVDDILFSREDDLNDSLIWLLWKSWDHGHVAIMHAVQQSSENFSC